MFLSSPPAAHNQITAPSQRLATHLPSDSTVAHLDDTIMTPLRLLTDDKATTVSEAKHIYV